MIVIAISKATWGDLYNVDVESDSTTGPSQVANAVPIKDAWQVAYDYNQQFARHGVTTQVVRRFHFES